MRMCRETDRVVPTLDRVVREWRESLLDVPFLLLGAPLFLDDAGVIGPLMEALDPLVPDEVTVGDRVVTGDEVREAIEQITDSQAWELWQIVSVDSSLSPVCRLIMDVLCNQWHRTDHGSPGSDPDHAIAA